MTLVLTNQIPHPWLGWLGIKRRTAPVTVTLDDYDALLFVFADSSTPMLSKLANAYDGGGHLTQDEIRMLLDELCDLQVRLKNEGTSAWPENAPGPRVAPTGANIEHLVATCGRVSALLETAIRRQATIWLDGD